MFRKATGETLNPKLAQVSQELIVALVSPPAGHGLEVVMETGSGLRCNSGFQSEWPEHLVNYTLWFEVCKGTFPWLTPILRSYGR